MPWESDIGGNPVWVNGSTGAAVDIPTGSTPTFAQYLGALPGAVADTVGATSRPGAQTVVDNPFSKGLGNIADRMFWLVVVAIVLVVAVKLLPAWRG